MHIPDHLINALHDTTRPLVIYRHEDGSFKCGFVLREDEFITSYHLFLEALYLAGLEPEFLRERADKTVTFMGRH